jgi:hypothetical protein
MRCRQQRWLCFVAMAALITLGAAAACGGAHAGSDASNGGLPGSDVCSGVEETPSCEAPIHVPDVEAAFAAIETLVKSSQTLPTPDLEFDTPLELASSVLAARIPVCVPPDGGVYADSGSFNRCFDWTFGTESATGPYPEGVTCIESAPPNERCGRLSVVAGTVVRFQSVVSAYPAVQSSYYEVNVVRACKTPCLPTETRCAPTKTCFASGAEFCLHCEGAPASVCACRDGCKAKPDGTECSYLNYDTSEGHTCRAGVCRD